MPLVIENGTIVAGANSYITTTELNTYAIARGVTIPSNEREQNIVLATDYFESLNLKGVKVEDDQPLQHPRDYLYIDGILIANNIIHPLVKDSICEIAMAIYNGYNPAGVLERKIKREKVYGAVEIEYADSSAPTDIARSINLKLRKLINSSGNGIYFKAIRA